MSNEFNVFDQIAQANVATESRRPTSGSRFTESIRCAAEVIGAVGLKRLFNADKKRIWGAPVMQTGRQCRHSADRFLYSDTRRS